MKDKKYQNHQGADPRLEWPTMKYRFWPSTPAEWRAVRKARETGDKYVIIDGVTYSVADIPLAEPEPEIIPPLPKEWRTYKGEAIPWNRPAWATERTIEHLTQLTEVPPGSASKAAFDAARDVLVWSIGREDTLADERHAERLAKGVQAHLRPFVRTTHYRSLRDWPPDNWTVSHGLEQGWPPFEDSRPDTLMLRGSFVGRTLDEWRAGCGPSELWEELTRAREAGDETAFYTMPHYRNLEPDELARLDELAMVDTAHGRVPWLSVQLAKYLRETFGDVGDKLAETWLTQEAEREGKRAAQVEAPGVPSFALPGWSDQWNTYNTPPALAALALAAWRAELRPELERVAAARERVPTSALVLPFAQAVERPPGVDGLDPAKAWAVAVVDAELARRMIEAGDLAGAAGQAVMRSLPTMAREAHVHGGRPVLLFRENRMEIEVQSTSGGLTEVRCIGGYQALARHLGADREAVSAAVRALAALPVDWHRVMADGRTTMVLDLADDRGGPGTPGVVSFALPRVLSPVFAAELAGRAGTRDARALVAVDQTVPPAPNPRTIAGASRLELAAVRWLVEHPAECNAAGGPVPWGELADDVKLSSAGQAIRRRAVLAAVLELWREQGRWIQTGERWRPEYGWPLVSEGHKRREDGRKRQARRGKPRGSRRK